MKRHTYTASGPRRLPLFMPLQLMFGSTLAVMGIAFSGFSLMMISVFALFVDFKGMMYLNSSSPVAKGQITRVSGTSSYVNDYQVFEFHHAFMVDDGQGNAMEYYGKSFSTNDHLDVGDEVNVRYYPKNPYISCIVGMDTSEMPFWVLLIILPFLLIGLGLLLGAVIPGIKHWHLVKHGELAWGVLVDKEPTNVTINGMPQYKMHFEFTARDRRTYTATARTHHVWKLEDDDKERILYDPLNPDKATAVDALPGSVRKLLNKTTPGERSQ